MQAVTHHVKIGFAPTRRSIFSAPDAIKYCKLTEERLRELNVDFVDIDDINEEGLLYNEEDRLKVLEKFRAEKIDGLFIPHCNFGTEYIVARLARELNVPVLLWGPLDEGIEPDGSRLRDSQCGLFATGKVLRHYEVKFTYLCGCRLSDPVFERGIRLFEAVCNVVKTFRHTRILQMGTRPYDFTSTMCNEAELLERFNIELAPIPLSELTLETHNVLEAGGDELDQIKQWFLDHTNVRISGAAFDKICALTVAESHLLDKYHCNAGAIQCWNSLQDELGIMPCAANSYFNELGIPITCETDIHGAISSLLIEAADMGRHREFFADWTVRHPDVENIELLQHCGPWACSVSREKPVLAPRSVAFDFPGTITAEAKEGAVTLCRFDGDNGEYSMLLGNALGIDEPAGPRSMGTYLWVKVANVKRLEAKIVEGPYIHHCAGIHASVVPVLYEACKYMGIKADLYDPIEDEVQAYIRGE
ncbi:MAG: L-fucose/L-arabinose isomerase family protein [Coriobacteriaceae bacterium]|nr:L-fucose/L-arabinose isomerase family protein [Coriobacteriaceae bacterium]